MAKEEGAKTVVVGGKAEIPQQYCGTVGGQSTDFSTIDTEVKVKYLFFSHTKPPLPNPAILPLVSKFKNKLLTQHSRYSA